MSTTIRHNDSGHGQYLFCAGNSTFADGAGGTVFKAASDCYSQLQKCSLEKGKLLFLGVCFDGVGGHEKQAGLGRVS